MYNNDEGTDIDSTHSRQIEVRRVVTEVREVPIGYIRFSEALILYGISKDTLWRWVKAGDVDQKTISHKQRFVRESDLQKKRPEYLN